MKFSSRKFIVSMTGMLITAGLALAGVMDANVAMVLTGAIVGYHVANGYVAVKGK